MQTGKNNHIYLGLMAATLVALVFVCGLLFMQNQTMQQQNRELIILNDSVMSANIELKTMAENLTKPRTSALARKKKS